ncbi:hypothetical protein TZ53_11115 [Sphingobium sp. YBL2]|nr:hypothetical protein TZ53_11115 [Sphingobium sp. YBL2]
MDLHISGRVAVVTGGSGGMGRQIVRFLAAEGAHVAIVGRDAEAGRALAQEVERDSGATVRAYSADLASDDQVDRAVAQLCADFGRIDILVNGAALPSAAGEFERLAELDLDPLLDEINVKVLGYLRSARSVAPHMQERGWGRIINIGGVAAYLNGALGGSIRTISVGAITSNLAAQLGPLGITVNCIHPGPTVTERSDHIIAKVAADQKVSEEEVRRRFASRSILGRFIDAREIAATIAFLCSPLAGAINGESLDLSGGCVGMMRY